MYRDFYEVLWNIKKSFFFLFFVKLNKKILCSVNYYKMYSISIRLILLYLSLIPKLLELGYCRLNFIKIFNKL